MSVYHRIDDMMELPGAKFIRLAERLPAYEGAVTAEWRRRSREMEEQRPDSMPVITAEQASDLPQLPGMPPLFEFD